MEKDRGQKLFNLNVDLQRRCQSMVSETPIEDLEEVLATYASLMKADGDKDIPLPPTIVGPMAMLALQSLSRHMVRKYR